MSDEKPSECESCEFTTTALEFYRRAGRPGAWFCEVCASTAAGSAFHYPTHYPDADALRMLAWGINYLAQRIDGRADD